MKPTVMLVWPAVVAGIDLDAPSGVNQLLVDAVRKVVARTRVPHSDLHFMSSRLDHLPLLIEHGDKTAVEWWLQAVKDMVRSVMRRGFMCEPACELDIEANVLIARDGDRVPAHRHAAHHFTVVYYPHVDKPGDDGRLNDGALSLIDDRGWRHRFANRNPAFRDGAAFRIHPRTGLMTAFPGYVMHETNAYRGPGERVSIAACVDVRMEREYA